MIDANKTDNGKTSGTTRGMANDKNLITETKSKSFPANSPINNQTVCKMNINKRMTNTVVNVETNNFNKYLSSIFTWF